MAGGNCESMLKRSHYIALVLVVLLTLIFLNLPGQTLVRLKLAIGSLFLPLFGLASSTHQLAEKAGDSVTSRSELLKQNEDLRRQNQELQLRSMQTEETARENARLRQLFGWQQKTTWKLKLASVVLRDPANWWRTVQIDLGTRDGMRLDLPVLTTNGLIGRISSVSLTRSQVVLLGDPNCKVAVIVDNPVHDMGVISGAGAFDSSLVTMNCYSSKDANLKSGQNVVTSGKGGIFPAGIPVGKVVDSRSVEYGLYVEARVKLAADLSGLEEVWVMFP
jgi:rod shape-determining protein MreC